jgi:hypothetical protein
MRHSVNWQHRTKILRAQDPAVAAGQNYVFN